MTPAQCLMLYKGAFMLKTKTPLILSILSLMTAHAYANQKEPVAYLGELTVTATRSATPLKNTIAQTTIINQDDLQRYQGQSVLDVLKSTGTISHYTNGGRGKTSNFYLRGYDGKQILVLIDGVRYSSMTTGAPALTLLPASQIDRIEIVHGASGSSVHGADAMGGVIQIFSKKSLADKQNIAISIGTGSHKQAFYGADFGIEHKNSMVNVSLSKEHSDGFNATMPQAFAYHPDKDGFDSKNFSASISHDFGTVQVGANALYSHVVNEYDNRQEPNVYGKHKVGAKSGYINWQSTPKSSVNIKFGTSKDHATAFDGADSVGRLADIFNTDQSQTNLTFSHKLNTGKIIIGAENLKQAVDSTNSYDVTSRTVNSGFVGYQLSDDKLDTTAFVRHTKNSQFGDKTTYNIGAGFRILPSVRIGASYATGFRVPTLNELYNTTWNSNNPNLKPEHTKNSEIFVEFNKSNHRTRLTAYHNNAKDLIAWQATPTSTNPWAGKNTNINKAKIKGVSVSSDWHFDNYIFGLNYDYQKAKNVSQNSQTHNHDLPIRPTHKGTAHIGYQHKNFDVRGEYVYTDSYFINVANRPQDKMPSYGLVNLSANYRINDNISISSRINNVFNKKYQTLKYYNEDGTNFYTAITFKY